MRTVADILGADGAAGEPDTLRRVAAETERAAEHVVRLGLRLDAFEAGRWDGAARHRYEVVRDESARALVGPAGQGLDRGAEILRRYAEQLGQLQRRARSLERALIIAHEQRAQHVVAARSADRRVGRAAAATHVTAAVPGAADLARQELQRANEQRALAREQLREADREIRAFEGVGHRLREELDRAAAQAASDLESVSPPPVPQQRFGAPEVAGGVATVGAIGAVVIGRGRSAAEVREHGQGARDRVRGGELRATWNATPVQHLQALEWAKQQVGQTHASPTDTEKYSLGDWVVYRGGPNGPEGEWSGDCIKFVQVAYDHGDPDGTGDLARGNAADVYRTYRDAGQIQSTWPAPAGAVVFWEHVAAPYGHVAIADGTGHVYSTDGMDGANRAIIHTGESGPSGRWGRPSGWYLPG